MVSTGLYTHMRAKPQRSHKHEYIPCVDCNTHHALVIIKVGVQQRKHRWRGPPKPNISVITFILTEKISKLIYQYVAKDEDTVDEALNILKTKIFNCAMFFFPFDTKKHPK